MVAAKGRSKPLTDRSMHDKIPSERGELKDFKIYVELDKVKNPDALKMVTERQSLPRKSSSCLFNANDSKSGAKNLEKGKRKPDNSKSSNVGRKVLADIGNRNYSFSITEQGKASKNGKGKIETMLYPQRNGKSERKSHPELCAVDLGYREESSLSSRESVKLDQIQVTGDNQQSKKSVNISMKVASGEPVIKRRGRSTVMETATSRKSVINPLHHSRKSLTVLKQVGQVETNAADKENSEKSDNSKGKPGIPVANKNIKVTSDRPRIKLQARSSIMATATGRKSGRNPIHLSRKSLPAVKQISQVETNGPEKESSEKSDNSRGKQGFLVKPSGRRSFVQKPSNWSTRPWGNRVSDDFILKSSRAQTKVDAGATSRKSVKPSGKTTIKDLNTRRNSKPSHVLTTKDLRSKQVDFSKRKQDKVSESKNVPSVESQGEHALEEDASTVLIPRRKSDRRNSFISSLMSRSKMLKECSKGTSRESLPNIYDDRNPLEVCDYVDDIYRYYWVMEGQNPLLKNYVDTQRDITPQMRGILINWLIEVHLKFDLMEETLFLTVTLLDRYLSQENIKKNEMQLVGLTALLLASKYEDFWHPRVADLISISAESYTRDQMLQMEKIILKKLKFRLNEPTPYVFMLKFIKAAQSDKKFERFAFYLIELCLVENEALNYKPSMLCASAIYVARCTMRLTPPWTPLLARHACYEESQIRDCAEMILKFHKAAKTSLLKVTYEKYAHSEHYRVATTIKPLDRLPA